MDADRGIQLYVKDCIPITQLHLQSNFREYIAIKIRLRNNDSLIICNIYRSPNSTPENNDELLCLIDELASLNSTYTILLGDYNLPNIDWNNPTRQGNLSNFANNFLEKLSDLYLSQLVSEPTRKRGDNIPSLLDLVITNSSPSIDAITHLSPLGLSDHCLLSFTFRCYLDYTDYCTKQYYMNKANWDRMRIYLEAIDWKSELDQKDTDTMWSIFETKMQFAQNTYIPNKIVNKASRKWALPIDKKLKKMINKKHRIWTRYMETRQPDGLREYKNIRNKIRNLTRKSRREAELDIAKEVKVNPKRFWNYVNSKSKIKATIPDLEIEDDSNITATTDIAKAEALAKYFSKVCTTEPTGDIPDPITQVTTTLNNIVINEDTIINKVKKSKVAKSAGPDQIYPRVLREVVHQIATPLKIIFNKSLEENRLPQTWKTAHVCAIHKKGPKNKCSNYRPISLTSTACKLLESIIRDNIMHYMLEHKYFSNKQYGFLPGRSTTLQLLNLVDEISKALDEGKHIETIYIDIQKAFDTVPHRRLLHKIQAYGITGPIFNWIQDFISNRTQLVRVNSSKSLPQPITSGVPQGSVLGPILFVIYVNDLPTNLNTNVYMFADDTKIYQTYVNQADDSVQEDLDALQQWSDSWLLKFHPEKCKQLHTKRPRCQEVLPTRHLYTYDVHNGRQSIPIAPVSSEKDLGITFDENLSFKPHIKTVINKANQMFGIIRRTFVNLTPEVFNPLYKALVRSHLEYGQSVWSPHNITEIKLIERVQRSATKKVNGFKQLSYTERMERLRLPSLLYRRNRGDMIECYKLTHDLYDNDVKLHLPLSLTPRRGHQYKLFKQRAVNLDIRKYAFSIRVVDNWNKLPDEVVSAPSLNSFKNRLDAYWNENHYLYIE